MQTLSSFYNLFKFFYINYIIYMDYYKKYLKYKSKYVLAKENMTGGGDR